MKPINQMKRARVQMYDDAPFFSHVTRHLTLVEAGRVPTACINERGIVRFNPDFIDGLSEAEVKGVLVHEAMHCLYETFSRQKNLDNDVFNVASDIVINWKLVQNGFRLPETVEIIDGVESKLLIPDNDGSIHLEQFDVEITGIEDHSAESIYEILMRNKPDDFDPDQYGFDEHESVDDADNDVSGGAGTEPGDEEREVIGMDPDDWGRVASKAASIAQSRGEMPAGMERLVDNLLQDDTPWEVVLRRFISRRHRQGYDFTTPNKKTRALRQAGHNTFMPSRDDGNQLDIAVAIDTSGSISDEELELFLGEMISIASTYNTVSMYVVTHDAEVHDVQELDHASRHDIVDNFSTLEGGGGTDHVPVYEEITGQQLDADALVAFTDGWTRTPDEEPAGLDTLWAVTNEEVGRDRLPFGEILRVLPDTAA